MKQESHSRTRLARAAGEVGVVVAPWCRSRSGRPWCSCRRSGSAPPPRPSADGRVAPAAPPSVPASQGAGPCRPRRAPPRRRPPTDPPPSPDGAAPAAARRRRPRCRSRPGNRGARRRAVRSATRSNPASTFGPVCIETQKHVLPAWPQFTATMNAFARRAAIAGVGIRAVHEHLVLDRDRVQFAGPHADERIARRRRAAARRPPRRRRCGAWSTAFRTADAGTASRTAGRPCSRTGRRPRAAPGGSVRPPAGRSSRPAGPRCRAIAS